MNILRYSPYDVAWAVIALAAGTLALAALVSLGRSPVAAGRHALAWAALIVLVPILGPVAWFAAGRRIHLPAGTIEP